MARVQSRSGKDYLFQVGNLRLRLAGYTYIARCEFTLDTIEGLDYRLPAPPKSEGLGGTGEDEWADACAGAFSPETQLISVPAVAAPEATLLPAAAAGQLFSYSKSKIIETTLPTIAGFISTALFALGTLPMLVQASQTRNLSSYSLANILLSNMGNVFYSLHVFNLPAGPIWFLHSYYLLSTALMLVWYLGYEGWPELPRPADGQVTSRFLRPFCCPATR